MSNSILDIQIKKNEHIHIALWIGGALIVTSFTPLFHITLLYLNSALFYLVPTSIVNPYDINFTIISNLSISVIMLWLFYRSIRKSKSMIYGILFAFFLLPTFVFTLENVLPTEPYFLQMLVPSAIIAVLLFASATIKKSPS